MDFGLAKDIKPGYRRFMHQSHVIFYHDHEDGILIAITDDGHSFKRTSKVFLLDTTNFLYRAQVGLILVESIVKYILFYPAVVFYRSNILTQYNLVTETAIQNE